MRLCTNINSVLFHSCVMDLWIHVRFSNIGGCGPGLPPRSTPMKTVLLCGAAFLQICAC